MKKIVLVSIISSSFLFANSIDDKTVFSQSFDKVDTYTVNSSNWAVEEYTYSHGVSLECNSGHQSANFHTGDYVLYKYKVNDSKYNKNGSSNGNYYGNLSLWLKVSDTSKSQNILSIVD